MGPNKPLEIKEYPIMPPPPGMARLALKASGVCGTDAHIWKGRLGMPAPMIIGHEFVGVIEEISAQDSAKTGLSAGDCAIHYIACACGECLLCKEEDDANCLHLHATNVHSPEDAPHFFGGYGEYNYAPVENLIKIPAGLSPELVCAYACAGPTALHAFSLARRAACHVEKAGLAVVQGLGPVGTFAVMYLAALGIPSIVAITAGNNPEREALALRLGASHVFNLDKMGADAVTAAVRALNETGADLVFEASGSPKAIPQGMEMLRNRGVYLVPGQYSGSGKVEISPELITFRALRILGSSQYSVPDVQSYLTFLEENPHLHKEIRSLCTAYPVTEANAALADCAAGKNIKTLLVP